jgi:hypothetical protein
MNIVIHKHLTITLGVFICSIIFFYGWALGADTQIDSDFQNSNNKSFDLQNVDDNVNQMMLNINDQETDSCSSCHNDFTPFKVYPEMPKNVKSGKKFNKNIPRDRKVCKRSCEESCKR